ncbi:hypothetical protein JTB14_000522 [Gonioctena quinquepunctata]|nr:hypothetical protein JTB14_000522 [Gonioctena quinquepunctata]
MNMEKGENKHSLTVISKNEDEDDLWTNNAELKTEDDLDIVYEDIKAEIKEEKPDILPGIEIGPNFSRELSIESGTRLQQNTSREEIEAEEMAVNFVTLIVENDFDIIMVSETWLTEASESHAVRVPGYRIYISTHRNSEKNLAG